MFDSDSDILTQERDRVLNAETRRALSRAARLVGVVIVGVFTAVVGLSLAAATVMLSAPWQLYVVVTAIVAFVLPIAVPYAMLRVYGLAHRDVVYVAKRAYREVVAEIIALSGTSTASYAFVEASSDTDGESDTDESGDSGTHNPVEGSPDDATPGFESGESADESSIANEIADTTDPSHD